MKILTIASVLALWAIAHGAYAQDKPTRANQTTSISRTSTDVASDSAAMADAARQKAEALERARDQRLRRATRSICSGC